MKQEKMLSQDRLFGDNMILGYNDSFSEDNSLNNMQTM